MWFLFSTHEAELAVASASGLLDLFQPQAPVARISVRRFNACRIDVSYSQVIRCTECGGEAVDSPGRVAAVGL